MADVFGAPELAAIVLPQSLHHHHHLQQQQQQQQLQDKGESPYSHSADSLNEGEPELESDADGPLLNHNTTIIDPEPYISSQFYTFNSASHHLMVQCILQNRYASPKEIRAATSPSVLSSWRGVWRDRNEDTAYLTGWKRIQDKLSARMDSNGNEMLFFKNTPHQYIPHISQWQDIVLSVHGDADLQHLSAKDTIERTKQFWTVGAKLYGIPESYIKVCVASCPVCSDMSSNQNQSSKRRRFEYTDSFEVQARDVPHRLQELAAKHQVVLCIRQKYVRFKPFLAEVKDYCCHRAGEPNIKKPGVYKRKRYSSKRCGCGFRIRTIVPITNYSEKEKTFSYLEEGQATFKLYAIHSGHEPGPHEGSARIMHRFLGSSGMQMEIISPFDHEEEYSMISYAKDEAEARGFVMQQAHELCLELQMLDQKVGNLSQDALKSLSHDISTLTAKLKNIEGFQGSNAALMSKGDDSSNLILHHSELGDWTDGQQQNKEEDLVHDHHHMDSGFGSSLGEDTNWERQGLGNSVNGGCCQHYESNEISVGDRQNEANNTQGVVELGTDPGLVSMPVDNYYQENVKWYDGVSCSLDTSADDLSHSTAGGY